MRKPSLFFRKLFFSRNRDDFHFDLRRFVSLTRLGKVIIKGYANALTWGDLLRILIWLKNLAFIVDLSFEKYDHSNTVKLWQDFLASETGGSWGQDQLLSLIHPSRDKLVETISRAENINYAFIVIIGKHELVKGELPWAENQIVAEGFLIKQCDICPNSERTTILYESSPPAQLNAPIPSNSVSVPNEWEVTLENAEMGVVTITAPDAPTSFSEELIFSALKWSKSGNGTLKIPEAIELLNTANSDADSDSQIYNGGRRRNHFPFAVS